MIIVEIDGGGCSVYDDTRGDDDVIIYEQSSQEVFFQKKRDIEGVSNTVLRQIIKSLCGFHRKEKPDVDRS